LDQELEGNALMLMVQDNLRVGLLTDHIPLSEVASHLTEELIKEN
jgi:4-hydroxythreonine-4-phosphate dehydrogenase